MVCYVYGQSGFAQLLRHNFLVDQVVWIWLVVVINPSTLALTFYDKHMQMLQMIRFCH
jgi:hypothetical protein